MMEYDTRYSQMNMFCDCSRYFLNLQSLICSHQQYGTVIKHLACGQYETMSHLVQIMMRIVQKIRFQYSYDVMAYAGMIVVDLKESDITSPNFEEVKKYEFASSVEDVGFDWEVWE